MPTLHFMGSYREEEKDEDDQSCSSADYSSSSSSSSWHSSSSNESYSSDGSERSFSSIASSQMSQANRIHEVTQYGEEQVFRLSSLMRNRGTKAGGFQHYSERGRRRRSNRQRIHNSKHEIESTSDASYSSKTRNKRGSGRRNTESSSWHWSSSLLAMSLLVWCLVQIATTNYVHNQSFDFLISQSDHSTAAFFHGFDNSQLNHKYHDGSAKNGRSHQRQFQHQFPQRLQSHKKKDSVSKKEMLTAGCELSAWQTSESNSNLLSCQLLHELDLSDVLSSAQSAPQSSKRRRSLSPSTHLGSGLWRDVWKLQDNIVSNNSSVTGASNFVVLKTMKPEHEIVFRNLERHRREAATMSRLTKSLQVANLYAYCGNSIVTEFANQDLSHALSSKARRDTNDSHNERRRKSKDRIRTRRGNYKELERQLSVNNHAKMEIDIIENENGPDSRKTSLLSSLPPKLPLTTRINLALQASKAVADMHRSDVIHADITTKQFLVISSTGGIPRDGDKNLIDNIQVKINDFNRCRFVPRRQTPIGNATSKGHDNVTNTMNSWDDATGRCTIRIPSAPGSYRSPEEYSDKALTPQIDIFSLGHVLYEIWTSGETPWQDVGGRRIKDMVMTGTLPLKLRKLEEWEAQSKGQQIGIIPDITNENFLVSESERGFGRIILKCYEFDPKQRITADNLVRELTNLLQKVRRLDNW